MKRAIMTIGASVGLGLGLTAPTALAACSAPVASGATRTVTCPGGTTATVQVPDHAGGVKLRAIGGDGGATFLPTFVGSGGGGSGTLTMAGPLALDVVAGTKGVDAASGGAGGTPGGGQGAAFGGGGGGGRSTVTLGATTLIVAGGGGGAGDSSQFGKGGGGGGGSSTFAPDGQPGGLCSQPSFCLAPAGLGGTQTAGGAGQAPGVAGSAGVGGAGGTSPGGQGGGGGGAGCFGGGGGGTTQNGDGGGGGGGSTCFDSSIAAISYPLGPGGDGQVVIEYSLPVAPQLTSSGSASFTVGAAGSHPITSSGSPAATISLDNAGDLPAGLTFTAGAAGSGGATISGTPTGAPGTVSVTVRASNGVAPDATQALTITVAPAPNPTPSPPPAATPTPTPTPTPKPPAKVPAIVSSGGGTVTIPPDARPVAATPTGVAVALSCLGPQGTTCVGKVAVSVRVRKRGKKIIGVLSATKTGIVRTNVGSAAYTIAAGRFKTVKVALNRSGRSLLKRFRRLKVTVNVIVTTSYGERRLVSRKVTIKRKKRAR